MNKKLRNTFAAAKVGVCLAGALVFASSSYGSSEAIGAAQFELHIVEKTMGGREIVAGDYSAAIEKIRAWPSLDTKYEASTNLCAIYIARSEFTQAETHCKAALRASRSFDVGGATWGRSAAKARRAMALNNYGVFRALKGDNQEAHEYFQSASKKSYHLRETSNRNINTLEQRVGYEVASS